MILFVSLIFSLANDASRSIADTSSKARHSDALSFNFISDDEMIIVPTVAVRPVTQTNSKIDT